jgi:ElaB/YqjD/DUF883 family membrane-anchored ribosome-binding protein
MANESRISSFPATRQDVAQLKQTAIDAASDLTSTAHAHANKAKGQLRDLAGHVQEEGTGQLEQLKNWVGDLGNITRNYVAAKPLRCVGIAFAVGVLFGVGSRRR